MIRVVIADDHALVRDGLERTLTGAGDIEVVGQAASSDALLELLERVAADVALIDIAMPSIGYLELLRRLASLRPTLRTIVVTAHDDEEYALRAFAAGALGYLDKSKSTPELIEAVRRVHRGLTYLTEAQSQTLLRQLRDGGKDGETELSEREYQVLGLLGAGKSIKEIGAALGVSGKTISTYRTRLLAKLGLKSTADLIRHAVERNIRG